jgi:chromosome segregation ATPase
MSETKSERADGAIVMGGPTSRLETRAEDLERRVEAIERLGTQIRDSRNRLDRHHDQISEHSRALRELDVRIETVAGPARAHLSEVARQSDMHRERVADLERSLGMASAENRRLEGVLETIKRQRDELHGSLGIASTENRRLEGEIEAVRSTRERAVAESRARGNRVEELESALAAAEREVKELRGFERIANARIKERTDDIRETLEASQRKVGELTSERDMLADLAKCTVDFLIQCDLKPAGELDDGELRKALENFRDIHNIRKWAILRWRRDSGLPAVEYFDARAEADTAWAEALKSEGPAELVAIVNRSAQDFPR